MKINDSEKRRLRGLLMSRVRVVNGHFLWEGACNDKGYGVVNWNGSNMYAHRLAALLRHGEIPPDTEVHHHPLCPKNCINPSHTEVLPAAIHKSRIKHPINRSRLTEQEVKNLKILASTDLYTQKKLAEIFDISASSVNDIINGRRWRHVQVYY